MSLYRISVALEIIPNGETKDHWVFGEEIDPGTHSLERYFKIIGADTPLGEKWIGEIYSSKIAMKIGGSSSRSPLTVAEIAQLRMEGLL